MRQGMRLSNGMLDRVVNETISRYLNGGKDKFSRRITEGFTRMNESFDDPELNYSHVAVNKETNLIVDGWDYHDIDADELKQFKRDYFMDDLYDNGFNPKYYKIVTKAFAMKNGLEWSNTGAWPLAEEKKMWQEGINPGAKAREEHPEWYID